MKEARTVEYDFVFGHADDPMGHVTGHTLMKRAGDAKDGWIRVIGHLQAQPRFERPEQRFDYGLDGERARLVNFTDGTYQEALRGAGANALALNAVYGYLAEFIEARPLWKELEAARALALLEPEVIDDTVCDVVSTRYDVGGRPVEVIWSIARTDHLPRRGRWVNSGAVAGTMTFTITNLKSGHALTASDFLPDRPLLPKSAVSTPRSVALGELVPPWELPAVDGGTIGSRGLRGKVAVLDFWNTWCFVCRSISPQTRALQRELEPHGVQFIAVNVFETGDAAAYWRDSGSPFPAVLGGETLAAMLDVSAQPAVAVIGADGRLRYTEVGATADRAAHIRQAVEAALADARLPTVQPATAR